MAMKSWSAGDKVLAADLNANFLGAQQNLGYGTSGEAFSIGQALYVKASDSRLYKAVGTGDESTYSFVGLAASASTGAAQAVTFAKAGGQIELSALTAGAYYYITDTAGTIGTTPGTRFAKIGQALSTTTFRIIEPKFIRRGTAVMSSVTTFVQTCGFYPAHVEIRCGVVGQGGRIGGISIGDDTNNCVFQVPGNSTTGSTPYDASLAWKVYDDLGDKNNGTVSAKSATGFTLNCTLHTLDATVQWVAYN